MVSTLVLDEDLEWGQLSPSNRQRFYGRIVESIARRTVEWHHPVLNSVFSVFLNLLKCIVLKILFSSLSFHYFVFKVVRPNYHFLRNDTKKHNEKDVVWHLKTSSRYFEHHTWQFELSINFDSKYLCWMVTTTCLKNFELHFNIHTTSHI